MPHPRVASVHVYPVKGCKGIDVQCAYFEGTGLAYDRAWMVVQESNGKFKTQRQKPRLALVKTSITSDALTQTSKSPPADAFLTLSAPDMDDLQIPLGQPGELKKVICWEFEGTAFDQGDEAAAWFTKYLKSPHRLVRYAGNVPEGSIPADTSRRPTDPKWTTDQEVAFADGFPALIISQGLLDELNKRLEKPLPMNRFRPNFVVTGCRPAEEDEWQQYGIGPGVVVEAVKPCDRCVVTCTDQDTGEVGKEPLLTLKEFRSSAALSWQLSPSAVFFGWNLVPVVEGLVRVNDEIEVIKRRETIVAVPSKADKAKLMTAQQIPQMQEDNRGGVGAAALQGIAAAVGVASILISFMYILMKMMDPQEPLQPT